MDSFREPSYFDPKDKLPAVSDWCVPEADEDAQTQLVFYSDIQLEEQYEEDENGSPQDSAVHPEFYCDPCDGFMESEDRIKRQKCAGSGLLGLSGQSEERIVSINTGPEWEGNSAEITKDEDILSNGLPAADTGEDDGDQCNSDWQSQASYRVISNCGTDDNNMASRRSATPGSDWHRHSQISDTDRFDRLRLERDTSDRLKIQEDSSRRRGRDTRRRDNSNRHRQEVGNSRGKIHSSERSRRVVDKRPGNRKDVKRTPESRRRDSDKPDLRKQLRDIAEMRRQNYTMEKGRDRKVVGNSRGKTYSSEKSKLAVDKWPDNHKVGRITPESHRNEIGQPDLRSQLKDKAEMRRENNTTGKGSHGKEESDLRKKLMEKRLEKMEKRWKIEGSNQGNRITDERLISKRKQWLVNQRKRWNIDKRRQGNLITENRGMAKLDRRKQLGEKVIMRRQANNTNDKGSLGMDTSLSRSKEVIISLRGGRKIDKLDKRGQGRGTVISKQDRSVSDRSRHVIDKPTVEVVSDLFKPGARKEVRRQDDNLSDKDKSERNDLVTGGVQVICSDDINDEEEWCVKDEVYLSDLDEQDEERCLSDLSGSEQEWCIQDECSGSESEDTCDMLSRGEVRREYYNPIDEGRREKNNSDNDLNENQQQPTTNKPNDEVFLKGQDDNDLWCVKDEIHLTDSDENKHESCTKDSSSPASKQVIGQNSQYSATEHIINSGQIKSIIDFRNSGLNRLDNSAPKTELPKEEGSRHNSGLGNQGKDLKNSGMANESCTLRKQVSTFSNSGLRKEKDNLCNNGVHKQDSSLHNKRLRKRDSNLRNIGLRRRDSNLRNSGLHRRDNNLRNSGIRGRIVAKPGLAKRVIDVSDKNMNLSSAKIREKEGNLPKSRLVKENLPNSGPHRSDSSRFLKENSRTSDPIRREQKLSSSTIRNESISHRYSSQGKNNKSLSNSSLYKEDSCKSGLSRQCRDPSNLRLSERDRNISKLSSTGLFKKNVFLRDSVVEDQRKLSSMEHVREDMNLSSSGLHNTVRHYSDLRRRSEGECCPSSEQILNKEDGRGRASRNSRVFSDARNLNNDQVGSHDDVTTKSCSLNSATGMFMSQNRTNKIGCPQIWESPSYKVGNTVPWDVQKQTEFSTTSHPVNILAPAVWDHLIQPHNSSNWNCTNKIGFRDNTKEAMNSAIWDNRIAPRPPHHSLDSTNDPRFPALLDYMNKQKILDTYSLSKAENSLAAWDHQKQGVFSQFDHIKMSGPGRWDNPNKLETSKSLSTNQREIVPPWLGINQFDTITPSSGAALPLLGRNPFATSMSLSSTDTRLLSRNRIGTSVGLSSVSPPWLSRNQFVTTTPSSGAELTNLLSRNQFDNSTALSDLNPPWLSRNQFSTPMALSSMDKIDNSPFQNTISNRAEALTVLRERKHLGASAICDDRKQLGGSTIWCDGKQSGASINWDFRKQPGASTINQDDRKQSKASTIQDDKKRLGTSTIRDDRKRPGTSTIRDGRKRPGTSTIRDDRKRPGTSTIRDDRKRPGTSSIWDDKKRPGTSTVQDDRKQPRTYTINRDDRKQPRTYTINRDDRKQPRTYISHRDDRKRAGTFTNRDDRKRPETSTNRDDRKRPEISTYRDDRKQSGTSNNRDDRNRLETSTNRDDSKRPGAFPNRDIRKQPGAPIIWDDRMQSAGLAVWDVRTQLEASQPWDRDHTTMSGASGNYTRLVADETNQRNMEDHNFERDHCVLGSVEQCPAMPAPFPVWDSDRTSVPQSYPLSNSLSKPIRQVTEQLYDHGRNMPEEFSYKITPHHLGNEVRVPAAKHLKQQQMGESDLRKSDYSMSKHHSNGQRVSLSSSSTTKNPEQLTASNYRYSVEMNSKRNVFGASEEDMIRASFACMLKETCSKPCERKVNFFQNHLDARRRKRLTKGIEQQGGNTMLPFNHGISRPSLSDTPHCQVGEFGQENRTSNRGPQDGSGRTVETLVNALWPKQRIRLSSEDSEVQKRRDESDRKLRAIWTSRQDNSKTEFSLKSTDVITKSENHIVDVLGCENASHHVDKKIQIASLLGTARQKLRSLYQLPQIAYNVEKEFHAHNINMELYPAAVVQSGNIETVSSSLVPSQTHCSERVVRICDLGKQTVEESSILQNMSSKMILQESDCIADDITGESNSEIVLHHAGSNKGLPRPHLSKGKPSKNASYVHQQFARNILLTYFARKQQAPESAAEDVKLITPSSEAQFQLHCPEQIFTSDLGKETVKVSVRQNVLSEPMLELVGKADAGNCVVVENASNQFNSSVSHHEGCNKRLPQPRTSKKRPRRNAAYARRQLARNQKYLARKQLSRLSAAGDAQLEDVKLISSSSVAPHQLQCPEQMFTSDLGKETVEVSLRQSLPSELMLQASGSKADTENCEVVENFSDWLDSSEQVITPDLRNETVEVSLRQNIPSEPMLELVGKADAENCVVVENVPNLLHSLVSHHAGYNKELPQTRTSKRRPRRNPGYARRQLRRSQKHLALKQVSRLSAAGDAQLEDVKLISSSSVVPHQLHCPEQMFTSDLRKETIEVYLRQSLPSELMLQALGSKTNTRNCEVVENVSDQLDSAEQVITLDLRNETVEISPSLNLPSEPILQASDGIAYNGNCFLCGEVSNHEGCNKNLKAPFSRNAKYKLKPAYHCDLLARHRNQCAVKQDSDLLAAGLVHIATTEDIQASFARLLQETFSDPYIRKHCGDTVLSDVALNHDEGLVDPALHSESSPKRTITLRSKEQRCPLIADMNRHAS